MPLRTTVVLALALFLTSGAAPAGSLAGEVPNDDTAGLLPPDTLLVVQAPDLGASVRALLALPTWSRFYRGPLGVAVRALPAVEKALDGLTALGRAAQTDELGLLDALAGDGSVFALLPPEPGANDVSVVLLLRARNAETVQTAFNALLGLLTLGTTRVSGTSWRLPLGDAVAERREDLFLVGNSAAALDRLPDAGSPCLADDPGYSEGLRELKGADLSVWARGAVFQTDPGIPEKLENVGASLIAGGPAEALRRAPWAAAELQLNEGSLQFRLFAPTDADALRASHHPLLPPSAEVRVPRTEARLATLIVQRDLGPWWTRRDEFIDERGVAESVKGDGNLSLVFQRDLGTEVMHWLEPELVLVADRNQFKGVAPEPEYPSGALGLTPRAEHPEDFHQAFVNAFFAVITFTNFDGGKGMTSGMLQPDMETLEDGSRLYSAHYKTKTETEQLSARANLSPGLLLHRDGRLWISSSEALLRDIAEAPAETVSVEGDSLDVDFVRARELIWANEDVFFARRLLREGGDAMAAQEFVDKLAAAGELFDGARLRSGLIDGFYELSLEISSQ
jgi:hypothetical protein